jgi:AcrR family transcriptional regulator
MDPEKRERLINSAFKEFSTNSYEKASTNTIIKDAGISKGLLYHYFSSKQALYEYLVDFFFLKTVVEMIDEIDVSNPDLLERLRDTAEYKLKIFKKQPYIIEFAKVFYKDRGFDDAKAIIDEHAPHFYEDYYSKGVDYSLFKEGIDIQKALSVVQITLEKFSEMNIFRIQSGQMDMDDIMKEFDSYLDLFKSSFYK